MRLKSGVYQIRNLITWDCYIGSSVDVNLRLKRHYRDLESGVHHNAHLQNAWNKYGAVAFALEPIYWCNKKQIKIDEQEFIDKRTPHYNIAKNTVAPFMGCNHTEETKCKMRIARAKQTPPSFGKKMSEEAKRKISDALKGREISVETRRRMSEAGKRKVFTQRHRKNLSEANKRRYNEGRSSLPERVDGEFNPNSKLDRTSVEQIRQEYSGKRGEKAALARKHGVSWSQIHRIVTNRQWK